MHTPASAAAARRRKLALARKIAGDGTASSARKANLSRKAPADGRLRRGATVTRVYKDGRWTTARTRTARPPTPRPRKSGGSHKKKRSRKSR